MLQRNRDVGRVKDGHVLNPKRCRMDTNAVPGLDRDLPGTKAPLWNFFVTRSYLAIDNDDRVQAHPLHAICGEVHACAVLSLVRVARRVNKESRFSFVIPFSVAAGDALLIALIEDDVSVGYNFIRRVVNGDLVGLQTIRADARVDVSFAD